jgi:ferric-dicitrate binding protein FerR (iron transport regulator)
VLTQNQDVTIRKQDGLLVYERPGMSTGDAQPTLSYHTLFIPRGQHYQVVLPDGSKVWLNAASSLRFPSAFTTKQRKVELNGEAYFEVAKDASKPFQVYVSTLGSSQKGTLVEVLGTHFNINAYDNEQVLKTTLLEGSVKVTPLQASGITPHQSRLLLPGQQAQIFSNSETQQSVKVHTVDVEAEVAWKNNLFNFHLADIKTIMRQMARWYDVEVVYEGAVPVRSFSGKINRNTNLNTVLKILEQSGIHFRVEGKRIIVRS